MEKVLTPRFSIVVPVFNDERMIAKALGSIAAQDYDDYEIVVVDDGSSDASLEVARSFAADDQRVSVLSHAVNKGAYQARKTGVLGTRGQYVLFLDGDDELAFGALTRLDHLISETPVDILHFAIKIVPTLGVDEKKACNHEKWLMPFHGCISHARVIEACLLDELYCWNLCGKLFFGDLCRKAFACCGDGSFSRAEDMTVYLMCAYFAQSYRGAPSEYLYYYNYGVGGDGASSVSADEFKQKWLSYPDLCKEFNRFLVMNGADNAIRRVYTRKFADILLRDTADSFVGLLSVGSYATALDDTIAAWGPLEILPQIALKFWEDQGKIARDASNAQLFKPLPFEPKRVAIYYPSIGGVEESAALMKIVEAWRSKGCFVEILVDDRVDENLIKELEDVTITIIQPRFGISSGVSKLRFQALQFIIERDSLDTVVYCSWLSHAMIWDFCFLKSLSIPIVLHFSATLARPLKKLRSYFSTQPYVFALCDKCSFDNAPAVVRPWRQATMRRQLVWARFFAMTYRSAHGILPRALSNKMIKLVREVDGEQGHIM